MSERPKRFRARGDEASPQISGIRVPVQVTGIDRPDDPIRYGDTPAKRQSIPVTIFTPNPDDQVHALNDPRGTLAQKAAQPKGRQASMDEYRLIGDGSHA